MTVKGGTMAAMASNSQAPESSQAFVVDDSSAKTIESLRARLLSERAVSKAARQQAQEIADKFKDLNARLEMEIKSRKEAESAMGKVFTILKAKGLAVDALALTNLKELEKKVSALDDIKEMNDPSCTMDPSIDRGVPLKPLENKDESSDKGMIEKNKHNTREPHAGNPDNINGIVSKVHQTARTCSDNQEASLLQHTDHNINLVQADIGENFLLQKAAEHKHCQVTDKPMVHTDKISTNGTPDFNKDSHTSQAFDHGSSIMLKLKTMLHQIEDEVAAFPQEQPLKHQLQSWVDRVAGMLSMEKDASFNGASEMHSLDASSKAGTNYPSRGVTKSVIHTGDAILLGKKEKAAVRNQVFGIPEGFDTKEDMGSTLSIVPNDMLQQANMVPTLTSDDGQDPSAMYPPPGKDPALPTKLFHNRRSYDSFHFSQQSPKLPMHPQMMQYGISQTSVAHAPLFANGSCVANGHHTGAEAHCIEAQSPRSSNLFSVGDSALKAGYRRGQWYEAYSQGRELGLERPAIYRQGALKCQSNMSSQAGLGCREIYSSPYVVDVSNEVHMKQDKYWNSQNMHLERGHAFSHRTYMDEVKNVAGLDVPRHPTSLPASDATLSLIDDNSGRLRDILMVLDAARQHVNDEEQNLHAEEQLVGPPTLTVEDARLNRDYPYDMQRVLYEHLNHAWQSRGCSQAPIIQFPPSPASDHAYSPFERRNRHHRSSSVSTNFVMSGWDSYLQPRGEVKLGNGITLYTEE